MIINDVNSLMRWKTSPLPTGYTLLNWIGTSGTQYINTGIYGTKDVDYKVTFSKYIGLAYGESRRVFGDRYTSNSRRFTILLYRDGSAPYTTRLYINCGTNINQIEIDNATLPDIITIEKIGNVVYSSGVEIGNFGSVSTFTTPNPILIGGFKNNGVWDYGYKGNFYACEINGKKFYPCKRNLDDVVGMYNTTDNVFLTNAGTGSFTYG